MTSERQRADRLLVELGLFESRAKAQEAIRAGLVSADGKIVGRPSDAVAAEARIEAQAPYPYVSRGGLKLAAALDTFAIDPAGLACLDIGASTGGFTDVLLRRGARHVVALDVGHGQLHAVLRADGRVSDMEGTDIRALDVALLPEPPRLVTIDVSFIALRLVLPNAVRLMTEGGSLVALIKPQFEAGRERVGRGGIVRDETVHDDVCTQTRASLEALGLNVLGLIPSPVEGGDGNREFLIGAQRD